MLREGARPYKQLECLKQFWRGGKKSFVIDVVDGDKGIRHYVPAGEILTVEAQSITNGDALGYGITVTAYQTAGRSVDIFYSEFEV